MTFYEVWAEPNIWMFKKGSRGAHRRLEITPLILQKVPGMCGALHVSTSCSLLQKAVAVGGRLPLGLTAEQSRPDRP